MRCAGPPYAGRPDELVLQRMKKAHTNITGTTRDFHMATNARCAARPTLGHFSPASCVLRLTVTCASRGNHIITVPQCVGAHSAEALGCV